MEDFVEHCLEIACCVFCCPCSVVCCLLPDRWDVRYPADQAVPKTRNKLKKIRKKEDEALRRKFRTEKRRFALLELPIELRKRIYELVLVRPGFYRPISTKFADRSKRDSRSILFTCKGGYEEARSIFFSENRFALASGDCRPIPYRIPVQDFVRTIGPINASLVRHVRLEGFPWKGCSHEPWSGDRRRISRGRNIIKSLEGFKGGLESLQIHMARRDSCDVTWPSRHYSIAALGFIKSDLKKSPYIRSFSVCFSRAPDCRFDEHTRTSMAARGWIVQQADEVEDDTHTTRTSITDFFRLEQDNHPIKDAGCTGKYPRHR
ncbi:hypothetical protein CKAH01_11957 [Colletotrichum kahawae]|uniref:F-box domain-containing protein n=1 Tax=Colletotrichum kahawae TaxID=34407 RepID=A0AAE0DDD3_COLKA|nr:hypothetical protein CKAH01_11957 [Colletotrichum kahawae]